MSQKPPQRSDEDTATSGPETPPGGDTDRTGARGKPFVPRGLGLAGDTVRPAEPVVSYGDPGPLSVSEQDRATLPPPVPMEQLVEKMMEPDVELPRLAITEELRALSKSSAETIPPPASDVDTVRTRGDEAKTIPPTGDDPTPSREDEAKTIPPEADDTLPLGLSDVATMPPPAERDEADTLPPARQEIAEEHEAIYRGVVSRESAASVTARAIDTAEAVFEELGVELFESRSSTRVMVPEELPRPRLPEERPRLPEELPRPRLPEEPPRPRLPEERPRLPEEPPRPRLPEERPRLPEEPPRPRLPEERPRLPEEPPRSRLAPSSRLTPPRTMRPDLDALPPPPPSAVSSRSGMRRKPSEPGVRPSPIVPVERVTPSTPNASVSERLNEVRERYEAADYRSALTTAETILTNHPDHLAALGYAESSRQMLRQKYLARIGDTSQAPRLKGTPHDLSRFGQEEHVAHIVKAIDGARSVDDIVAGSGLSTLEVLCVLHDLLVAGVIELGTYAWGR